MMRFRMRYWAPALIAGALLAAAVPRSPILAFARIQTGAWQLRPVDGGSAAPQRLCVSDPEDLIQLRHPGATCTRYIVGNEAQEATVQYRCNGAGYGRTTIKVETPQLIRVETQGLANQMPFQMAWEGRRVGMCGQIQAAR